MSENQTEPEVLDAQAITQRALELAGTEQAEVSLYEKSSALTRFSNNAIHQNVAQQDAELYLRVAEGGRVGLAMTNQFDDAALAAAAQRARAAAAFGPPALAPLPAVDEVPLAPLPAAAAGSAEHALDARAIDHPAERRAELVLQVCRSAAAQDALAFGAYQVEVNRQVFANRAGRYTEHRGSSVDFQTVVMLDGSSGWAQDGGWNLDQVPVLALGEEALRKAVDGVNPGTVEPEPLPVVLDPYATADLIDMLDVPGMGSKAVADGQSWMNDRLGLQAMSELVNLWDDGHDADGIPAPFDSEGTVKRRTPVVSAGVINGPVYDRATAEREGVASSGHALPLNLRPIARIYSPAATNLFMQAGEFSTEELIRATQRGLYVTRFWYTRHVHPRDCVVTGMTRDGVFLIENGVITRPVKNLRFTQSYVEAMRDVVAVGSETRLITEGFLEVAVRAPAVKIKSFRFTGLTV